MKLFSALLAICAGNSPVTGEFPSQRLVTLGFDIFFDLRLNKRLSKQSWGWWFETPSRSLWRHRYVIVLCHICFLWCFISGTHWRLKIVSHVSLHYNDVTMGRWRLKSPASRLFTQPFIRAQIKGNIKASRHWPLCGEFTDDRCIPRTYGQYRGKCFHLMKSSWGVPSSKGKYTQASDKNAVSYNYIWLSKWYSNNGKHGNTKFKMLYH